MNRLTVFACEAQPIVLEGLAKVLSFCEDLEYIGAAANPAAALIEISELHPDLVLVDQASGLKAALQFVADLKRISMKSQPILWVHELPEIDCFRALQLGARGIAKKTLPVSALLECLRSVGQGNLWLESSLPGSGGLMERRVAPRLTPREKEIVHHVCGGLKNKEIAAALAITPGTVKVHLMHIFEKIGVKDRFELAIHGRRLLGTGGETSEDSVQEDSLAHAGQ